MLITKADRRLIHEYLFREGTLVAKKDYNLQKHPAIDTKNLYVIKVCQSLTSRGYLKTRFSWQYYYYSLTPEGTGLSPYVCLYDQLLMMLDYLREWLHAPADVFPETHIKKTQRTAPPRNMGGDERRQGRGAPRGDQGYRRREAGDGKDRGKAPGEFAPQFRGGYGRARGADDSSS